MALAWFGRRALPAREPDHEYPPVLAVLVGGIIALLLYVVPVLGFIAYKALDVLGLGIVVYTLLLAFRARRAASALPPAIVLRRRGRGAQGRGTGADAPAGPATRRPRKQRPRAAAPPPRCPSTSPIAPASGSACWRCSSI